MAVEESLENRLDEANGWVDGTTRNARGDLNSGVESKTNGESVHWHVLGSVVLHDLEDKGNEEEGHNTFDEEDLEYHFTSIVAAISWAKLGDVVGAWSWKGLVILWESDHGTSAKDATEKGTDELEKHHNLSVHNSEWDIVMSVLNHHTDGNSGIKMSTTNRSEHLCHDGDCEADADWCVR